MGFITAIGTAHPPHRHAQQQIADFMIRAMELAPDDARKLKAIFRASGIEWRHSVLSDYGQTSDFEFYENTPGLEPFPSTRRRVELYKRHALAISLEAVLQCFNKRESLKREQVTHLVVVSCTGMYAPGLDIDLVKACGLSASVERTCINFMGCYAAFNALKLARLACQANPAAKVLVVCTELCSIHFQKAPTEDNILANALFGDGAAAVLVEATPGPGVHLSMEAFHCNLQTEGEHDMTWSIGDFGFDMRLSSYVPAVIRTGIRSLTRTLLTRLKGQAPHIDYYAIHPGGKKILTTIEEELSLRREDNEPAYHVLRNHGNMSSPTVLFVIKEIADRLRATDDRKHILSFAFGPGLTLESMLLKVCLLT